MHKHEWNHGMVRMGSRRGREVTARAGAVCECGLVALPPTRADKRKKWAEKMGNPTLVGT